MVSLGWYISYFRLFGGASTGTVSKVFDLLFEQVSVYFLDGFSVKKYPNSFRIYMFRDSSVSLRGISTKLG